MNTVLKVIGLYALSIFATTLIGLVLMRTIDHNLAIFIEFMVGFCLGLVNYGLLMEDHYRVSELRR